MKTIYKFMVKWYLSGDRDVPRWLENRLDSKRELAVFYRDELVFNKLLSDSMEPQKEIANKELTESILHTLKEISNEESDSTVIDARSQFRPFTISVVGIAAMLVVVLSVWNDGSLGKEEAGESEQFAQNEMETDNLYLETMASWKNPLDQEIDHVVSDAKGALLFLANNFLPSEYVEELNDTSNS